MNQSDFIKDYVNGKNDGEFGNVSIKDGVFYHYWTPMIERKDSLYIVNVSRYSDASRFLLKKISSIIPMDKAIKIDRVPLGYKGKLSDFLDNK